MSQFSRGTRFQGATVPDAKPVMALLMDATVMVDAGETPSGWEALRLGRALFMDQRVQEQGATWAQEMLEYGATVIGLDDLSLILPEIPQRSSGAVDQFAI